MQSAPLFTVLYNNMVINGLLIKQAVYTQGLNQKVMLQFQHQYNLLSISITSLKFKKIVIFTTNQYLI